MFGFGKKVASVDRGKVVAFADWFFANEERIRRSVDNGRTDEKSMYAVLDEVEAALRIVYRDGYKGNPEFDYGGSGDEWELYLYHKNNKFLISATEMLTEELSSRGSAIWRFISDR